jgi:hypothetical protein
MNQETSEAALRLLLDRASIGDVVTRFTTSVDLGNWQELRSCFTEEIDLDYTSLHGGEPEHLLIDQIIERWSGVLRASQAIQHILTNQEIVFHEEEVICTAYVQAHHFQTASGELTWTLGGRYILGLTRCEQGWKIHSVTFIAQWVTGDQEVIARSQKRFAQPQT